VQTVEQVVTQDVVQGAVQPDVPPELIPEPIPASDLGDPGIENNSTDMVPSPSPSQSHTFNKPKGKPAVKKLAKDAYSCINQINKQVIKQAKEQGIVIRDTEDESAFGAGFNKGSAEAARSLHQLRNNKVLQAVYTLLEDNIEAIMAKGLMLALGDSASAGVMIKYFIDMYTPKDPIKSDWETESKATNLTQIQQVLQIKMVLDTAGISMSDLRKLVDMSKKAIPESVTGDENITRLIKQIVPDAPELPEDTDNE
jgi:hypothetical protein